VHAAGRRLAVTMSHRFDADKQTLERLVASGDYGPLHYLVCRMTYNMRRRGDWGGPRHDMADPLLVEGAAHQLDVVRAIGGANARRVFASSWNPPWGEYAGAAPRSCSSSSRTACGRSTRARRRMRPRSARGRASTGARSAAT
jgi:predicted dehydrogenase